MSRNKVVLIGLDSVILHLLKIYFGMDRLPNIRRMADEGIITEVTPVFPTHTASNWNSIATGAWPKTHGITDMVVHLPGTPLTQARSGFYSDLCKAEHIWQTCEKFNRKTILLKYIGSWPPSIKKGKQVEGFGAPGGPGSRPWGSSPLAISNSACHSTLRLENANLINFSETKISEWTNIPDTLLCMPLLQGEIKIGTSNNGIRYYLLLLSSSPENKYDRVLMSKVKDGHSAFILKKNQFSPWITDDFKANNKRNIKAYFRVKFMASDLINNSNDNLDFKLYVSQIFPVNGWTFPESLSTELVSKFGPFLESVSHFPYTLGWVDVNTFLEDLLYQANWLGNATKYLMAEYDWDLYMMQWHGIDHTQHAFLRFDKSVLTKEESDISDRTVLRSYEIADELVGNIIQGVHEVKKNNPNDNFYTFLVSDHGHTMGKRRFFINDYLYQKGFIKLKRDSLSGKIVIDWKNTRAFAQGMVHIYVNLYGRDPQGIVTPGDEYDRLVQRLIEALYDIKDPRTMTRPISMALTNRDADLIGLSGDRAGDVVFATNSVYAVDTRIRESPQLFEDLKIGLNDASIHGSQLPSLALGEYGTMKSVFIANGTDINKNYIKKESSINIIDIAPTIAHLLDIPAPKNSEGRVLHEFLRS